MPQRAALRTYCHNCRYGAQRCSTTACVDNTRLPYETRTWVPLYKVKSGLYASIPPAIPSDEYSARPLPHLGSRGSAYCTSPRGSSTSSSPSYSAPSLCAPTSTSASEPDPRAPTTGLRGTTVRGTAPRGGPPAHRGAVSGKLEPQGRGGGTLGGALLPPWGWPCA